jgi:hypothetical protein
VDATATFPLKPARCSPFFRKYRCSTAWRDLPARVFGYAPRNIIARLPINTLGEELLTIGHPTMLGRGRVKSKLLPPWGSSLYGAIQLIGQSLRARYQPPEEVPSDMVRLLTQLNESTEPELQLPSKLS